MGLTCCRPLPHEDEEEHKKPLTKSNSTAEPMPVLPQKITLDDFELLNLIGKGAFAKVILVKKKSDNHFYAMKVLKKREVQLRREENNIISERKILENTNSPFIVNLKFAFQNARKLYMVMEFMPGGELFFHLSRERRFNEQMARFYISEVVIGLEYLHNKGIIYRDLKPENILIGLDGHIKLTDFGLSKISEEEDFKTRTMCGTPEYQAPEIILGQEYGSAVDFWSVGCLLYELILGRPPFMERTQDALKYRILNDRVSFTPVFSESARNLVDKLLVKDPVYRLVSFERIKKHEFFDGLDWAKVEKKLMDPPFKPKEGAKNENFDREVTEENIFSVGMSPSPQGNSEAFPGFTYKDSSLIH